MTEPRKARKTRKGEAPTGRLFGIVLVVFLVVAGFEEEEEDEDEEDESATRSPSLLLPES